MKTEERPDIRAHYLGILQDIIEGRRSIPELRLTRHLEPNVAHISELELCPMKPYYARTLPEQPPLSEQAVLQFTRGRLFERMIAAELPVKEKDGISGTVDGELNGGLIEVKSTATDMGNFTPAKAFSWWLQRSKGYAVLHDTDSLSLVVWFLVGDIWTAKTTKTDLRAWTLTFTKDELDANWAHLIGERAKMFACINDGALPDEAWVKSRRKGFECGGCRYSCLCPYFNCGGM